MKKDNKPLVLLDLSILKHPFCGLGQIALNYLRLIRETDTSVLPFRFVLLVPRKYFGCCGDKVDYVPRKRICKWLPWLYPKVSVWHAIHQLSPFRPYSSDTHYLLTVHDFNYMYEKSSEVAKQYHDRIQQRINRASVVTCISRFTESELYRYMQVPDTARVEVIANGVEFAPTGAPDCPPKSINPVCPFFFSIGEIKEKKNFMAIVRMMRFFPDTQLYIAGNDGTAYAADIRRFIADEGLSNVRLLGLVSNEERLWLYRNCRAFLFPSLFEGFGLPVIEAMSLRKPVFCSNATALKETGDRHAFFFRSFEPEEMAAQIKTTLPEITEHRLAEAEQYARSFSYEKHFNAYIRLYTGLCSK